MSADLKDIGRLKVSEDDALVVFALAQARDVDQAVIVREILSAACARIRHEHKVLGRILGGERQAGGEDMSPARGGR